MILTTKTAELWSQVDFFQPVELGGRDRLSCPCCGLLELSFEAMKLHDDARRLSGVGFWVTEGGGCRCPSYQESLILAGKTRTQPETASHCPRNGNGSSALDISVRQPAGGPPSSLRRFSIIRGYVMAGCERLGVGYQTFIHADWERDLPRNVAW